MVARLAFLALSAHRSATRGRSLVRGGVLPATKLSFGCRRLHRPLQYPLSCLKMERFCSETEAKKERGRVVVIAGPTAVGKSKVAHALAARLDGEVISADSVQVYRGLDIGSNKPSVTERQSITYHLVDIMEPSCDAFSAGSFFQLARQATADILHRHRLPIVVGGTMMYLRWYILGKPATVAATPAITQAVVEELELDGWDWDRCLARLAAVDPARAAALHRNDWYRLRRAMEVVKSTGGIGIGALPRLGGAPSASTPSRDMAFRGVVPSETPSVNDAASTEQCNSQADDSELDYNFYCYFLVLPRALLNRLIDARCEDMVARGLLQETAALLQGPWAHAHALEESFPFPRLDNGALTAFRAIGYRQSIEYLIRGERTPQGLRLFLEKFMQASRQYARRQIQWYRSEQRFRWRAADRPDLVESIENELLSDKTHFRGHDEEDRRLRDESYREAKSMKRYRPTLQLFDTDERAWQVLREVDWFRPTSHPAEAKPF